MSTAGRGPDPYALVVAAILEDVQAIQYAGATMEQAYGRYQTNWQKLRDLGTEWKQDWPPHVRQALAELHRRAEPDVEEILPSGLRAVT
jgi:hypothetical protein